MEVAPPNEALVNDETWDRPIVPGGEEDTLIKEYIKLANDIIKYHRKEHQLRQYIYANPDMHIYIDHKFIRQTYCKMKKISDRLIELNVCVEFDRDDFTVGIGLF